MITVEVDEANTLVYAVKHGRAPTEAGIRICNEKYMIVRYDAN